MADLLTHFTLAKIFTILVKSKITRYLFYFGTFLPDLLQKFLEQITRTSVPFTYPTHFPTSLIIYCYLFSLFFKEELRKLAFFSLFTGSLLHLFIDLFSLEGYEISLYQTEDAIYLLPINIIIIVLIEIFFKYKNVH